ncbi:MAG: hypothetical protein ACOCVL_02945, partial [Candidatus Sumerlaeota bacterium]
DKWSASSRTARSCIQKDALRLTDFKELGRFLSGLLEADTAGKVNCLYDYRKHADILGDEEFWCLEYIMKGCNQALLLQALQEVLEANARMELELHKIMRKLDDEAGETKKRLDQVALELEAFSEKVRKIKEYREKADKSQLSEREKEELNRAVERIRQFKDHERDELLAERETLQRNLKTLDLRRRIMGLYRDACIVVNILISKRSSAILRESMRRMRNDFASLIEKTAPPEIDQYASYSDSSVERQERARLYALEELRATLEKLTRQLDPVLMLVHDFYYLTGAYKKCELSPDACQALHRILRQAHTQLH